MHSKRTAHPDDAAISPTFTSHPYVFVFTCIYMYIYLRCVPAVWQHTAIVTAIENLVRRDFTRACTVNRNLIEGLLVRNYV